MPTRKNHTSKKSNNKFRKTRSKRQTRKSKKKTRSKRGGGQVLSTIFNTQEPPSPPPSPEPPVCPICTEVFEADSITITTVCEHRFHTDCLRPWCSQHREATPCPSCRRPIGSICRELLFTDLEKTLFDAIKVGEIYFAERALAVAEEALADSINDDGTPRYDNNNNLLLDVDVRNKDGDTPLILAAETNQVEMVDMLLNFGADVDVRNKDGDTPLIHAAKTDQVEIVDMLLRFGADVDAVNKYGDTPLILAAKNNQVKIVDMLLRFGAYVDAVNKDGYNAFNATTNQDIIDLLIEYGTVHNYVNSNVDSGGNKKSKKTRKKYKTKTKRKIRG